MSAHEKISESIVEQASLDWLKGAAYEIVPGLEIEPEKAMAGRSDFKQVFLSDPLKTKLLSSGFHMPAADKITETRA